MPSDMTRGIRLWRLATSATIHLACFAVPAVAAAQTTFEFAYTPVDVATYRTVEECLAATERVNSDVAQRERVQEHLAGRWRDTLAYEPARDDPTLRPMADTATRTMQRCAARYTLSDTTLRRDPLHYLLRLLLAAGRDTEASALLAQRVAAVPATGTVARRMVEDTALSVYRRAQPFRRAAMERIYGERSRRAPDRRARISVYQQLAEIALQAQDTVVARRWTTQMLAEWDQLPATQRGAGFPGLFFWHFQREWLDSLRQGTPNYFEALLASVHRIGDKVDAGSLNQTFIGKPAPTVTGDFWFRSGTGDGRADRAASRPTRGKVGLVVFIDPPDKLSGECLPVADTKEMNVSENCWSAFAVIQRLAQRFPALEVTLVAQTRGYFVYRALPDSVAVEVDLIRQWLLDAHRLPGTLIVQTTPAVRLPDPDRRRLHVAPASPLGLDSPVSAFIVDRDGIVIDGGRLERSSEAQYAGKIEAMLQQPQRPGVSGRAPSP